MKTAIIAGAGPAGLTAALELLRQTDIHPVIFEETERIGGISATVQYKGNRMDIGGHRFFSKNDEVMRWWQEMMPLQGAPSLDDILLNRSLPLKEGGPNPQQDDRVMLLRDRVSRIFFLRHFFDYPISVKWATFAGMGLWRTVKAVCGYLWAALFPKPETSLENFYINRFGRPLYEMFFEDYTEKVWGVHPSKIGADWGSQRVKGLSVLALLKDVLTRPFRRRDIDQKKVETSLIEQFIYPKFGPGQLWETVADEIRRLGGEIHTGCKVTGVCVSDGLVEAVEVQTPEGLKSYPCDLFFSTMPLKDLIGSLRKVEVPRQVARVAENLPYRDFITVGLLVRRLKIQNTTKTPTFDDRVPDTWIYVQERDVKVGRLQIFNNWSPYMVADYEHTMFVGMEYFCDEGDALWTMDREAFIKMAVDELVKIQVTDREDVLDATQVKIRKAYPAYFGTYYELPMVREFLDKIDNLYCLGRNGQHRYNNMDHSMLTAMEAVRNIRDGRSDKDNIWSVNTEESYHESKQ
ncbi:MAG: NAD(P)/FAD-dependent oxidoreductase [Bacteroidales bacterium]|nr:NAD(P)/FAD-dependent oxidoreductase [Bacteroidales bacterium]